MQQVVQKRAPSLYSRNGYRTSHFLRVDSFGEDVCFRDAFLAAIGETLLEESEEDGDLDVLLDVNLEGESAL